MKFKSNNNKQTTINKQTDNGHILIERDDCLVTDVISSGVSVLHAEK